MYCLQFVLCVFNFLTKCFLFKKLAWEGENPYINWEKNKSRDLNTWLGEKNVLAWGWFLDFGNLY